MQKSNAGVFVTSLQLYPGRYEVKHKRHCYMYIYLSLFIWLLFNLLQIKFIVNGEWKVDHNRPITGEGGYENNVLIIV